MARHTLMILAFALVTASALNASAARAQEGLAGTWKLAVSSAETSQRRAAVETATQELPSFMQARGREKLEERTTPPPQIRIAITGDRVELTQSGRTLSVTVGGAAVPIEFEGRRGSAQASRRDGHLVITMQGDKGIRTTTYLLSEDGQRMVLDVQFAPKALSTPVRYRVTYKRS